MDNDMENLRKRRGCFSLDVRECFYNPSFWGRIMGKMLISRCEHLLMEGLLEYNAYSSLFREVDDSEKSPHYEIRSNEFNDIEATELVTKEV